MITVPLPRLLDGNLQEVRRLHPLAASLSLVSPGVGEAILTLAPDEPQPAMHQWMELFTQHGSAGYYRVTAIARTYAGETQLTLRHGIDTLSDSVLTTQAEEATMTVRQLLTRILGAQTARVAGAAPWQLGACQDSTSLSRAFNYDNLADLLAGIEEEKQNYYFTYDFSTSPWTLNFVAKPAGVQSEFRLSRNIESLTVSLDDAQLCTQLFLSVNVMTTTTPTTTDDPDATWPTVTANDSVVRTYNNASAQAEWGIVQKTASIDTQDDIAGQGFPSADAWAARFMADHSQPTLQIQISGEDLYELTGDRFDETRLATLCRVALPDHDAAFSERTVGITYPDVYGAPTSVTVSLANRLPRFSNAIAQAQQQASSASATAATAKRSAGGGGGGTAKELESWAMIVKKSKEAQDATGITEMYETGIILDAETGATLYSLKQGFVSQYAELKVQSGEISTLVQTTDGHSSAIRQNAESIQTEVTNRQNADQTLSSRITQTADKIESEVTRATEAEGTLSSRITQTADQIALKVSKGDVSTQLAVECGNVTVSGGNLVVSGYVTASAFQGLQGDFNDLISGNLSASKIIASTANFSNLEITNSLVYGGYGDLKGKIINALSSSASGGTITISSTTLDGSAGPSVNFNIADTQYYKDGVAAAKNNVTLSGAWDEYGGSSVGYTVTASNKKTHTVNMSLSQGSSEVYLMSGGLIRASVSIPSYTSVSDAYKVTNWNRYNQHLAYYSDSQDKYLDAGSGWVQVSSYSGLYKLS